MANGLRWISTAYDLGYTFTLCEGIRPQDLLVRMGTEPHRLQELSDDAVAELQMRPEDGHLNDLDFLDWEDESLVSRLTEGGFLSHPEAIVRAGAVPGWAYAVENITSRAPAHLAALSQGTRAYTVFRSVNGEHEVGYAVDGQVLAYYEPVVRHTAEPDERRVPGFEYSGDEPPDVAFLRFLEIEHGIHISWEDFQAPLPTAAFA
ncbi:DUF6461 domain-containing protein [Streptomyces rubiginosohelvolus]|uniref:DUF6461 domain-containing protein n=1 Tax=Streptomyces TaxID=1883 RepID=UPI001CD2A790|nr:DUF6461 domain-containing protein [Streptomyces sp. 7G]MCA1273534.1 DUF6461 domain-containing protein [Streptomyces sp. 7G]